jgi:NAD(P)-dependent dehydrogenase (short-subunit alcohol dehydrogenase family)
MSAMNRTADPAEIARAIVFLISPDASYIDGATLVADGGLCMY